MKSGRKTLIVLWLSVTSLLLLTHSQAFGNEVAFLSLDAAYELAQKNHEQILYAQKEVEKSRLLPKKADSIMLPKVNISGEYREYDEDIAFEAELGSLTLPPIVTIPEHQLGGNFEVVQPLYKGNWLPRKEQAHYSISRDSENYYQISQNILFQVAQVYYEVIKSKELVKLSQEILKLANEEKQVAKARFEEGAVTEDAVLNADLKITSTKSKLIEYGNRLTLTKKILKRLIGGEIGEFDVMAPPALPMDKRELSELIDIAAESRHDYKKVKSMVDIAEADMKVAKSKFHPSLQTSWDYFSFDNPSYYQDTDYWIFAVQLTVPIYEGGIRFHDLKEKRESVSQAELAARDFYKNIRIEVEEAMLQVKTNESVLVNLEKQEELAKKNYEIVFSKFKYGAASSVDLNQAISTLDAVKSDLAVKRIDLQISLLKLKKAIGLFARDIIPAS